MNLFYEYSVFLWSQNLPHVDPVAGPAHFITPDDVLK